MNEKYELASSSLIEEKYCKHEEKISLPSDLEHPESLRIPADRIPWLRRRLLHYISYNQLYISGDPIYISDDEEEPPDISSYEDETKMAEEMLRAINGIGFSDQDIAQGTGDYWVMIPVTLEQQEWLKGWLPFNSDGGNYGDPLTAIDVKGEEDMINYFLGMIDISLST
jgi:hypothetical protein